MHRISRLAGLFAFLFAGFAFADPCFTLNVTNSNGDTVALDELTSGENYTFSISQGKSGDNCSGDNLTWGAVGDTIKNYPGSQYTSIELGSDLDFGGYDSESGSCNYTGFEPIGGAQGSLSGVIFDGKNHTVKGLCYVNADPSEASANYAGFFGNVAGTASFSNVTFEQAFVDNSKDLTGFTGVLVAYAGQGEISISNVTIQNSHVVAGFKGGSLAGELNKPDKESSNAAAEVLLAPVSIDRIYILSNTVSFPKTNSASDGPYLGGMVGYWADTTNQTLNVDFSPSAISIDKVVVTDENGSSRTSSLGGIAGKFEYPYSTTFSGLKVNASISGGYYMGGYFGQAQHLYDSGSSLTIKEDEISGSINLACKAVGLAGGFIGKYSDKNIIIKESKMNMDLVGSCEDDDSDVKTAYIGGLVGQIDGSGSGYVNIYIEGNLVSGTISGYASTDKVGFLYGAGQDVDGNDNSGYAIHRVLGNLFTGSSPAVGIGSMSEEVWLTGTDTTETDAVSEYIYGNFNLVAKDDGATVTLSSLLPSEDGTGFKYKNGSLSSKDGKTDLLAALMNYYMDDGVWSRSSESVPSFADATHKPIYMEQFNLANPYKGNADNSIVNLANESDYVYAEYILIVWTDSTSKLTTAVTDSLDKVKSNTDSYVYYAFDKIPVDYKAEFGGYYEMTAMATASTNTFNIVYQYLNGDDTISFSDLPTRAYNVIPIFLRPRVDSASATGTEVVPMVAFLDNASDNKEVSEIMKPSYVCYNILTEAGVQKYCDAFDDLKEKEGGFAELIGSMDGAEDGTPLYLLYQKGDKSTKWQYSISSETAKIPLVLKSIGYDNEKNDYEVYRIDSNANDDYTISGTIAYTNRIALRTVSGYSIDSYTVNFSFADNGTALESSLPYVGSVVDLYSNFKKNGTGAVWNITMNGSDTLNLDSLQMAASIYNADGNSLASPSSVKISNIKYTALAYTVTFDLNPSSDDPDACSQDQSDIFLGSQWAATIERKIEPSDSAEFPQLFSTKCNYAGWSPKAEGGDPYSSLMSDFLDEAQIDEALNLTAYAQWNQGEASLAENLVIRQTILGSSDTSSSSEDIHASVILYQTLKPASEESDGEEISHYPEEDGEKGMYVLALPIVSDDSLFFRVSVESSDDYAIADIALIGDDSDLRLTIDGSDTLLVVSDGFPNNKTDTIAFVVTILPEGHFVFDKNSDRPVFYGDDWIGEVDVGGGSSTIFPTQIFRADAMLMGWSLEKNSKNYYTKYDLDFYKDLLAHEKKGLNTDTLYAVWNSENIPSSFKVTSAYPEMGTLLLSQHNGELVYEIGFDTLLVPEDMVNHDFRVDIRTNAGYEFPEDSSFSAIVDGEMETIAERVLVVNSDMAILARPTVLSYTVTFDANESGSNCVQDSSTLFFGKSWTATKSRRVSPEDSAALPTIYSTKYTFVGWTPEKDMENDDSAEALLTSAFLDSAEIDEESALTAYAVWSENAPSNGLLNVYGKIEGAKDSSSALDNIHATVTLSQVLASGDTVRHPFVKDTDKNQYALDIPAAIKDTLVFKVSVTAEEDYPLEGIAFTGTADDNLIELSIGKNDTVLTVYPGYSSKVLDKSSFVLTFGGDSEDSTKADKRDLEIVNLKLKQSGSAIRVTFETGEFEVDRGVTASAFVMDALGNIVVDTVLVDSVPEAPYSLTWVKFPLELGDYTLAVQLADARDTVTEILNFSVDIRIASVKDGWQMISMASVDTASLEWDGDQIFYWWDEMGSAGEYWQYKLFERGDEIDLARGYWYNSLEGRELALNKGAGAFVGDVAWELDSLYSGWNMVANPYGWNLDIYNDNKSEKKDVDEKQKVTFLRYNSTTGDYEEVQAIKPLEAIWAHVDGPTSWNLKGIPEFDLDSDTVVVAKRNLAKANGKASWTMQAILSDDNGKLDSWNVFGVSETPFVSAEAPAAMGDHVSLSFTEGVQTLAKSFKAEAGDYEWNMSLGASSNRTGSVTLEGVAGVRSLGYHVYLTVDGKTTEIVDNTPMRVSLRKSYSQATLKVTERALKVAASAIEGLHMTQASSYLNIGFDVDESYAGCRMVVDILGLDGKVLATSRGKALAGHNTVSIGAPKASLYMLRVRVANEQATGRVLVK